MMNGSRYIIGIDLGTTNSTVSYIDTLEEGSQITQMSIPQLASDGNIKNFFSLPSFLYFPMEEELKSQHLNQKHCIGEFAKTRGAEIPSRVIASSKSWLCHTQVDRRSKLLPFQTEAEDIEQLSPLEACAEILKEIGSAWNAAMPSFPLKEQQVLITVPASFDPSAQSLVQEAAGLADFPEVTLLEEPLAAFYAWLHTHESDWRDHLKVGDSALVVDIGGGTTDFSLISAIESQGNLQLQRKSCGDHLLLGGDNIDLALAYLAKQKLEGQGRVIDDAKLNSLVHLCRSAKETLLNDPVKQTADITLLGKGSKLIGSSMKTFLTKEEVVSFVLDGFFPYVKLQEKPAASSLSGMQSIGLPYAEDPKISSHLANFLSSNTFDALAQTFDLPSAILFNGGTIKAAAIEERLVDLVNSWKKQQQQPPVQVLRGTDYDYAVSCGAVFYGLARRGRKIRIKSGINHSYFLGVQQSTPAVPGFAPPISAICIAPLGMEEGSEQKIEGQQFTLAIGEKASFRFFSRSASKLSDGAIPRVGDFVKNYKQDLIELPAIETTLGSDQNDEKYVVVSLKSRVTELGFLELWCESKDKRKWKLEFDVRGTRPPLTKKEKVKANV